MEYSVKGMMEPGNDGATQPLFCRMVASAVSAGLQCAVKTQVILARGGEYDAGGNVCAEGCNGQGRFIWSSAGVEINQYTR